MTAISIYATSNTKQSGIILTDTTDWSQIPDEEFESINTIKLELYKDTLASPVYVYNFTSQEVTDYLTNRVLEILFIDIAGIPNISDSWYSARIVANTDVFVSNFSGFGIYADVTYDVFSQVNSLHAPEENKHNAEKYCTLAMWRQGLKFLDTTSVNSREIKFNKRLQALQKMLLKI